MNLIDKQNSLVIDVTFNCNAKCQYCQWGNKNTPGRINQSNEYIYIPYKYLDTLSTDRIVFSGGEPLLRFDLEKIIHYYTKSRVESIITITNGILLNETRLNSLVKSGMTGITFSIDSINESVAKKARGYSKKQLALILRHIEQTMIFKEKNGLEVGVNIVISTANLYNKEIEKFIEYTNNYSFDWIKFQPIFDDGYVGKNAPELLLSEKDAELVLETGKSILNLSDNPINPIEFWESIRKLLKGDFLLGSSCGLDTRQTIAQKGDIKICPWIKFPKFSLVSKNEYNLLDIQNQFSEIKRKCKTGTHCYCMQKFNHKWKTQET